VSRRPRTPAGCLAGFTQRSWPPSRGLLGADVRVGIGAMASEEVFKREAPNQRVIHLATYGVLNKHNPLFFVRGIDAWRVGGWQARSP
jgi:hypothetical protein